MSTLVPLAVASDRSQSIAFSEQRLINLYPETSQLGGKSPFCLIGTPGLKPYAIVGPGPHRGAIKMGGIAYFVSGTKLYSLLSTGVVTELGTIPGSGFVSMDTAGTQIAISIGTSAGYIYDSNTVTLTQITDPDFFGGAAVAALDGYFLWKSAAPYTNRFQISALLDGLSYDALDFASAESTATDLIRPFRVGSQSFMMKTDRIEVWYNSGNADFPFERLNSTIMPKGLAGKFTPTVMDNSLFWLGQDDEGSGSPVVYRANGYNAQVISTHAVARALSAVSDLNDILGIAYVKDNHSFYGLIFPEGNSWFFDAASNEWHERNTYDLGRWLGNVHVEAYGKTLVGSYADGAVYELDLDTYIDAGVIPITAEATLPTFGTDAQFKRCTRLRLDMETGVGLNLGQGSNPIVTLNVSDDRGETWSSDLQAEVGAIGQYGIGVEWRRMGQFRSRVHKFRITDPVKRAFIALYADVE